MFVIGVAGGEDMFVIGVAGGEDTMRSLHPEKIKVLRNKILSFGLIIAVASAQKAGISAGDAIHL
jgi:hypothetical protein